MARTPNRLQARIAAFAKAMDVAEVHRKVLGGTFGLDDRTIGMMTLAHKGARSRHPYANYAAAVHAAQRKLKGHG
jgi:hypothetical protein